MRHFLLSLCLFAAASVVSGQTTNAQYTVLASAVQTAATVNSADQVNTYYKGGHILINVSAYTSGNYTVTVQGKDASTGTYYTILVGPAISSTGITVLKVYPGIGAVPNGSASDILPQTWRVQLTGAGGPSMTLSVDVNVGG